MGAVEAVATRLILWACVLCVVPFSARAADKVPSPAQVKKARELIRKGSTKVRLKAAEVLARSGEPDVRGLLASLLQDEDAIVRAAACDLLVKTGDVGVLPFLEEATTDADALVRGRATAGVASVRATMRNVTLYVPELTRVDAAPASALGPARKRAVEQLAENRRSVADKPEGARWHVQLHVHEPRVRENPADTIVEVTVSATVTEWPGKQLRFSSRVRAGAAVEGGASERILAELTQDAVVEAARNATLEVDQWLAAQPR